MIDPSDIKAVAQFAVTVAADGVEGGDGFGNIPSTAANKPATAPTAQRLPQAKI